MTVSKIKVMIREESPGCNEIFFSVNRLKKGKRIRTSTAAQMTAKNVVIIASSMNCWKIAFLMAPETFLTPTSFARFKERAVARFIKFMHAINRIKAAIIENNLTYSIRPPSATPLENFE